MQKAVIRNFSIDGNLVASEVVGNIARIRTIQGVACADVDLGQWGIHTYPIDTLETYSLTDLEIKAIADLWQSSKGNGHDFGFTDDMINIPAKSRGGVAASLSNKGFISIADNEFNQFEFTDSGKGLFVDFRWSSELK